MRNKIVFSIALLAMLFVFGSCHMHTIQGTPYRVWHITPRTHRHFGASRRAGSRYRYWGNHRYGPRPFKFRGRYREYQ